MKKIDMSFLCIFNILKTHYPILPMKINPDAIDRAQKTETALLQLSTSQEVIRDPFLSSRIEELRLRVQGTIDILDSDGTDAETRVRDMEGMVESEIGNLGNEEIREMFRSFMTGSVDLDMNGLANEADGAQADQF